MFNWVWQLRVKVDGIQNIGRHSVNDLEAGCFCASTRSLLEGLWWYLFVWCKGIVPGSGWNGGGGGADWLAIGLAFLLLPPPRSPVAPVAPVVRHLHARTYKACPLSLFSPHPMLSGFC
jgi:hypothetical protein